VLSAIVGDSIVIDIQVAEVTALFGVAFDFVYSAESGSVAALSAQADPVVGTDILFLQKTDNARKTISVGLSRKAGQTGLDGSLTIARIVLTGFETAPSGTLVNLELQNIYANDAEGKPVFFTAEPGTPVVTDVRPQSSNGAIPSRFALAQNFPNPFNPATLIQFDIAEATHVSLTVYDILGRRVRALVSEDKPAGSYKVQWDGLDNSGQPVANGIYIYQLQASDFVAHKKMVMMK